MSELKKRQMPKGYAVMWAVITAVYAVWMIFFMKDNVLVKYETVASRTVDGYLQQNITGMMGAHWLYPIWVIVSCATLLLFIVYISEILYAGELTKAMKTICLFGCIIGCIYIFVYGFFDVTKSDGTPAVFEDKVKYITASMIGLEYPWCFRVWGVLGAATIFMNSMYAYRRYEYSNRFGIIAGSIGSAAIYMTINCPSYGENKDFSVPRCLAHWMGALVFAFGCAVMVILLLFGMAKREKGRFLGALIVFGIVLLIMLVLLITVGKSAIIENIPMVAAYVMLFILNFTDFFVKKKV